MERFSVCIPTYAGDKAENLRAAVDSVLCQSAEPDELILVADGPVGPELEALLQEYASDARIKLVRLPENRGHAAARQAGLLRCRNDLVALMDADDLSRPGRFEKQLALFAADPSLACAGGQIREFSAEDGAILGIRRVALTDEAIRKDLKKRCPMNQMTVMLRKSAALAAGGYREQFCNEDYDLWLRMCRQGMKFANLEDVLVDVRMDRQSYRRRGGWRYFASENAIQRKLLSAGLIGPGRFCINCAVRASVQLLAPAFVRRWIYVCFARTKKL